MLPWILRKAKTFDITTNLVNASMIECFNARIQQNKDMNGTFSILYTL